MTLMKGKLKGAQKGHSLLKKKTDALRVRFRSVLKKIIEVCNKHFSGNLPVILQSDIIGPIVASVEIASIIVAFHY